MQDVAGKTSDATGEQVDAAAKLPGIARKL